jgi:hypothetical protein
MRLKRICLFATTSVILMIWTIIVHAQNPLFQEPDYSNIKPYVPLKEEVKTSPDLIKSNSTKTEHVTSSTSTILVCSASDYCKNCFGTGRSSGTDCEDCSGLGYRKGHSFQVAEYDDGEQVSYFEALKICESKGNGWRLPKANELKGMDRFLHRKGLGNFSGSYWGYTPYDPYGTDANVYHFNKGFGSSNFFEAPNNLRLVRDLP